MWRSQCGYVAGCRICHMLMMLPLQWSQTLDTYTGPEVHSREELADGTINKLRSMRIAGRSSDEHLCSVKCRNDILE